MQHRSVNAAGHDLRLSPSAVSHALARLRQALDDELFVFGETGMEPTARARQLAPSIRNGLGIIESALASQSFVPSQALRTFRIAATDYAAVVLLPPLVAGSPPPPRKSICASSRPIGSMSFANWTTIASISSSDGSTSFPQRLQRSIIWEEEEAVVVRSGHPLTQSPLTKQRLLDFPHVVVDLIGGEGPTDNGFHDERGAMRRVWIERLMLETDDGDGGRIGRVAVSVPHYAAVPPLLLASDMVATLPKRMARRVIAQMPLAMLDLPYAPLRASVEAIWHERSNQDPGIRWFIDELREVMVEPSRG